ncbi:MAG: hypothetical protein JJU42_10805 [Rhodobacteraceae bacterium]|nr:hypothetical protein [Paracoccaceae bacterium]
MHDLLKPGIHPDPVPAEGPRIPRKLWQTTRDRHAVPPELAACVARLKGMHPDWEHTLLDDETQAAFIARVASDRFRRAYDRINPRFGAMRSDMFRYLVVYLHGGVYLDLKSGTTRPLDTILRPDDRCLLSHWDNGPEGAYPGSGFYPALSDSPRGEYQQWFVIAEPGHPYLAAALSEVLTNIETYGAFRFGHAYKGVLTLTGPVAFTRAIRRIERPDAHRMIESEACGLHYTVLDNTAAHRLQLGLHYSRIFEAPITDRHLDGAARVGYWTQEMLYWPVTTLRRLNHARLDRRSQKRHRVSSARK